MQVGVKQVLLRTQQTTNQLPVLGDSPNHDVIVRIRLIEQTNVALKNVSFFLFIS